MQGKNENIEIMQVYQTSITNEQENNKSLIFKIKCLKTKQESLMRYKQVRSQHREILLNFYEKKIKIHAKQKPKTKVCKKQCSKQMSNSGLIKYKIIDFSEMQERNILDYDAIVLQNRFNEVVPVYFSLYEEVSCKERKKMKVNDNKQRSESLLIQDNSKKKRKK